jgi:hypothetical protein
MPKKKHSIPEIRARLRELAKEHGIDELKDLADELHRSTAVKRAPVKSQKLTPALAAKIRQFAKQNPDLHQRDIASHFDINPGRVSEALNNLI